MSALKALMNDDIHLDVDLYPCEQGKQTKVNTRKKPRYKVDLVSQQAECEANYYRLHKILPDLKNRDAWNFAVDFGSASVEVQIKILDRAPYTTTLQIRQLEHNLSWANVPVLTVCLYHDVNMAEVIAWKNHSRLRARYDYPNPDMYHCDEKAQFNQFLREWLTLCQCHGRCVIDFSEFGFSNKVQGG